MKSVEPRYQVGIIIKTHGLKGEVKVKPTTDFPERFQKGKKLLVTVNHQDQILEISQSRQQGLFWFLNFKGLDDINVVTSLVGKPLYISNRNDQLDKGEFYVSDLIGLPVYDLNGISQGYLEDILSYGSNDVWVIANKDGREQLLPYTADFIKEVDLRKHKIIVDLELTADES